MTEKRIVWVAYTNTDCTEGRGHDVPTPEQLQAYRAALNSHDWSFEYSDDHSVWQQGRAELGQLQAMQRALDPDFTVWNEHAPSDYQHKPPKVAP